MAEPEEKQPPQKIDRKLMEQLMFGTGRVRRFTQDSPVLPDVWLEYAKASEERNSLPSARDRPGEPFPAVKLLLTPYREHSTGDVRIELRERLARAREEPAWEAFKHFSAPPPRVIYNQSTVAVRPLLRRAHPDRPADDRLVVQLSQEWKIKTLGAASKTTLGLLAQAIKDPERAKPIPIGDQDVHFPTALLWMVRVAGALAIVHRGETLPPKFLEKDGVAGATVEDWKEIVRVFAELVRGITPAMEEAPHLLGEPQPRGLPDDLPLDARDQGRRRAASVQHLLRQSRLGHRRQRRRRHASRFPPGAKRTDKDTFLQGSVRGQQRTGKTVNQLARRRDLRFHADRSPARSRYRRAAGQDPEKLGSGERTRRCARSSTD